ncbi:MAG: trigger factor [Patescibacteria group bacterium]|jgi:trigger factor
MPYVVEKSEKNRVKLTITIPKEAVEAGMRHSAEHLSEDTTIPGFRPGKAPYETIVQRYGEMKILEAATEELIKAAFVEAMLDEDLETVGQPYFNMVKLAPGNEMVFTAEMSLMPEVKKLADYKSFSIKAESTTPSPETIEQAKTDLTRMKMKETRAEAGRVLAQGDKAVVKLTMKKDGVEIEGGSSENHGIYTNEPHYIPGFVEKIIGAKEGEERLFTLKFPADHYQKHLAGKDLDFHVKVNEIFTLDIPALDDEFAKGLGLPSADELMKKLHENLSAEKIEQENRRQEKELLELLAEKSTFDEFSDLLVNQEIDKMVEELKQWVDKNGMEWDKYLVSTNKSITEIKLDFTPQAIIRLKVALVLNEVAKLEKITPTIEEVDHELDELAKTIENNPEAKEYVYSPAFRERIEHQVRNRKTLEFLKKTMVK